MGAAGCGGSKPGIPPGRWSCSSTGPRRITTVSRFPTSPKHSGIRWLMAERPGYRQTAAAPGASLAEIARMVVDDLDEMGIDRFAVLGYSGGGPHALACAVVAPERVRVVGLFSSWAPMHPPDPGLTFQVRFGMRVAATLPRAGDEAHADRGAAGKRRDGRRCLPRRAALGLRGGSGRAVSACRRVARDGRSAGTRSRRGARFGGVELHEFDGDSHELPRSLGTALHELSSHRELSIVRAAVVAVLAPAAHLVHVEQRACEQEHHDREREERGAAVFTRIDELLREKHGRLLCARNGGRNRCAPGQLALAGVGLVPVQAEQ